MSSKDICLDLLNKAQIPLDRSKPYGIEIKNEKIWNRILSERQLGLAEGYMDGWWECDSIDQFLSHLLDIQVLESLRPSPKLVFHWAKSTFLNRQTKSKADKNAKYHYNIGNDLYSRMLDSEMVYSCAYWKEAKNLDDAQIAKLDLICRKLGLKPGMKLLDIGCGWGSLIIHAAKNYGVKAIGVTLSKQQLSLATQRVKDQNLTDQVEIRLQDYREVPERDFDAISSVGMSEHVGDEKLDAYFAKLKTYVKDGGMILNHCIVRPTSKEPAQAGAFIDRYIFPDGELTAASRVSQAMIDNSIELRHSENLREHYAMTLNKWCQNLKQNWQEAVKIVGEQRARIWLLYMTVSQIGFEINNIQIHQFLGVVNHADGSNQLPLRQYW